jgi:hypothetical protein
MFTVFNTNYKLRINPPATRAGRITRDNGDNEGQRGTARARAKATGLPLLRRHPLKFSRNKTCAGYPAGYSKKRGGTPFL